MILAAISDLWNKWNIRGSVIVSLSLQIFLILFAPLRKKTAKHHIVFFLWLSYLMADWVAAFTIGLISHNQGNSCAPTTKVDGALLAFWASFLLLHLGGPDTITAFSLEDSKLWSRHLLSLIFQVGAAIYVFVQIFPNDKSLVIPTMLVFLAGVMKNAERTLALNLSSLPKLKEWVLPHHSSSNNDDNKESVPPHHSSSNEEGNRLVKSVKSVRELVKSVKTGGELLDTNYAYHREDAKLAEGIVVKHAYYFFQIFKVFIGDLMFTSQEREISRGYFKQVSPMDALRVISVELQFMYEVLHTKVLVIRSKWSYFFRFIVFIEIAMALVLFNRLKKHRLPKLDVQITYILLFGAIALDVIALFMLIFSDWTVAEIKWYTTSDSFLCKLVSAMDDWRKPRFTKCEVKTNGSVIYMVLDTPLIFRRWSESISACNLFSEMLKKSPRKMYKHNDLWGITAFSYIYNFPFQMTEKIISCLHQASKRIAEGCGPRNTRQMIANAKYVSKNPFIKKLWIFIFEEVKRKSTDVCHPNDAREIFEARGDMFLKKSPREVSDALSMSVTNANYDDTILMWHLATEMLYHKEKNQTTGDEMEFSKILSDYMLYLLLNQSNVVSAVGGVAQMTAADVLLYLQENYVTDATKDVEKLCVKLCDDSLKDSLKSLPLPAPFCVQANLVQRIEGLGASKWKVVSGVWVEMLSYAATHIKGEAHVQALSKGGELLAFVWLLMAHFGCFYKPEWGMYYEPGKKWSHSANYFAQPISQ